VSVEQWFPFLQKRLTFCENRLEVGLGFPRISCTLEEKLEEYLRPPEMGAAACSFKNSPEKEKKDYSSPKLTR